MGEMNPYYAEKGRLCSVPINVWIKYRNGYSLGRTNVTFASNEEATLVVERMNGRELKGRKIAINWALPIKDYQFNEKRNKALGIKKNEQMDAFLQGEEDDD